jgi:glutathione S-transferase
LRQLCALNRGGREADDHPLHLRPVFWSARPEPLRDEGGGAAKDGGPAVSNRYHRFRQGAQGKLPYINDDGEIIADSTFIRLHIEKKYGFDFDAGLSLPQRGTAWVFEKMCEDHLYWQGCICAGWSTRISTKAPRQFFDAAVAPLRPLVVTLARRQFRRNLWGRGMGRHTLAEMEQLATRDIDAIADLLAGKPYLMGLVPCGADAATFPFMAHALCPLF